MRKIMILTVIMLVALTAGAQKPLEFSAVIKHTATVTIICLIRNRFCMQRYSKSSKQTKAFNYFPYLCIEFET